jgi:hypothetical protein
MWGRGALGGHKIKIFRTCAGVCPPPYLPLSAPPISPYKFFKKSKSSSPVLAFVLPPISPYKFFKKSKSSEPVLAFVLPPISPYRHPLGDSL